MSRKQRKKMVLSRKGFAVCAGKCNFKLRISNFK